MPLHLVVDELPSAEFKRFASERLAGLRVVYDVGRAAAVAFGNFGTPSSYVLDASGRIRYVDVEEADLPLMVEALMSR